MTTDVEDTPEVIMNDQDPASTALTPSSPKELETFINKSQLDAEDLARAQSIADSIAIDNRNSISNFGIDIQKNLNRSSKTVLDAATKDTGEAGELITQLIDKFNELDVDSLSGRTLISRIPFFGKRFDAVQHFLGRYTPIREKIDEIASQLDDSRLKLKGEIQRLSLQFEDTMSYFRELRVNVAAGEIKIEEMRQRYAELEAEVARTNDLEKTQRLADLGNLITRMENRVYDLRLSAFVAYQQMPQIRLIQAGQEALADQSETVVLRMLPGWQDHISISIAIFRMQSSTKQLTSVYDMNNQLLASNSELLKVASIDAKRQLQRGEVDVETLRKITDNLVATLKQGREMDKEWQKTKVAAGKELAKMQRQIADVLSEEQSQLSTGGATRLLD